MTADRKESLNQAKKRKETKKSFRKTIGSGKQLEDDGSPPKKIYTPKESSNPAQANEFAKSFKKKIKEKEKTKEKKKKKGKLIKPESPFAQFKKRKKSGKK